jgi:hypothetical protein
LAAIARWRRRRLTTPKRATVTGLNSSHSLHFVSQFRNRAISPKPEKLAALPRPISRTLKLHSARQQMHR